MYTPLPHVLPYHPWSFSALVSLKVEILFHILLNFQCQKPASANKVWLVLSLASLVCPFPKISQFFAYLNPFSLCHSLINVDL